MSCRDHIGLAVRNSGGVRASRFHIWLPWARQAGELEKKQHKLRRQYCSPSEVGFRTYKIVTDQVSPHSRQGAEFRDIQLGTAMGIVSLESGCGVVTAIGRR